MRGVNGRKRGTVRWLCYSIDVLSCQYKNFSLSMGRRIPCV